MVLSDLFKAYDRFFSPGWSASYSTTQGSDGEQPVTNMAVLDESGLVNNPSKYVQFQAKTSGIAYAGYRTYTAARLFSTFISDFDSNTRQLSGAG